jgi:Ecdysteroid kinase-like family
MRGDVELDPVRRPEDLSPDWLTSVLGGATVTSFTTEPIGTGQMSDSYRVRLTYADGDTDDAPRSVVLKVAASDATSRQTGVGLGIYEREIRFYREVAPDVDGPVATCHHASFDPAEGWFTLLLEDAAPAVQGDQITGCAPNQAALAINELARIHASTWEDERLGSEPWLNQPSVLTQELVAQLLAGFLERYAERVSTEHREVCERFVAGLDAWLAVRPRPYAIQHADYRLDNLLFGLPGSPKALTVVDWQTVGFGPAMLDAAYLLAGSLTVSDRRAHEQKLLRGYHEVLLAGGVSGFPWEACWEGYRHQAFHGVLMPVAASMLVVRTARGDDMFMTSLARSAQQVLDLDALELLIP